MAYKMSNGWFSLADQQAAPNEEAEKHLKSIRNQIETMNDREKLVAETILCVGQTLCVIINNKDAEAFNVLRKDLLKLLAEADSMLKHETKDSEKTKQ